MEKQDPQWKHLNLKGKECHEYFKLLNMLNNTLVGTYEHQQYASNINKKYYTCVQEKITKYENSLDGVE